MWNVRGATTRPFSRFYYPRGCFGGCLAPGGPLFAGHEGYVYGGLGLNSSGGLCEDFSEFSRTYGAYEFSRLVVCDYGVLGLGSRSYSTIVSTYSILFSTATFGSLYNGDDVIVVYGLGVLLYLGVVVIFSSQDLRVGFLSNGGRCGVRCSGYYGSGEGSRPYLLYYQG